MRVEKRLIYFDSSQNSGCFLCLTSLNADCRVVVPQDEWVSSGSKSIKVIERNLFPVFLDEEEAILLHPYLFGHKAICPNR